MQGNDAHFLNKKAGYLDPHAICEARYNYPSKEMDDHDFLVEICKTCMEKKAKRVECHKDTLKKVLAYIAIMMLQWKDKDCIDMGAILHPVSLISIICCNIHLLRSMPKNCINIFFADVTRLLFYYSQNLEGGPYLNYWIEISRYKNNSYSS